MMMTGTISSVIATAVRRWRQKSVVPECEEPRLRTRRAACASRRGRSSSASDRVGDDPDQDGQRNARDQRAPGERLALIGPEAIAEVPEEVADPAAQMMQQRPRVAEQDQLADDAAGEGLDVGVGPGAGG